MANTPQHDSETSIDPRAIVLLAAGQGARLRPLTERTPKSMLDIDGRATIETILDPLLSCGPREVVVVTGFEAAQFEDFVQSRYEQHSIRFVENKRFREDTNILSTHMGVEALDRAESGYFIVEADIIAPADVWTSIVHQEEHLGSYWVTRGRYNADLTGGIVNVDAEKNVTDIRYEPIYDHAYEGWLKMVGVLSVGPDQVIADRETRAASIQNSVSQYYMQPWIDYALDLKCQAYDLEEQFAMSFNTEAAYKAARQAFAVLDKK